MELPAASLICGTFMTPMLKSPTPRPSGIVMMKTLASPEAGEMTGLPGAGDPPATPMKRPLAIPDTGSLKVTRTAAELPVKLGASGVTDTSVGGVPSAAMPVNV